MSPLPVRTIIITIGIALALVLAFIVLPGLISSGKVAKKQAEVATGQSGATISTAEEAGNTVANVTSNAAETDKAVATSRDEVRAAPDGQKTAATRLAACRFKANRNKPECKQ